MKHLPNILSLLRMVGAVVLLLCDVVGTTLVLPSSVTTRPSPSELRWLSLLRPFWVLYALCGFSDIADGWLARKLKCVTRTGALLDSVADICFVACCAWKLLPILELPQWLWLWAGVIVAIKVVNQLSALVMYFSTCDVWALLLPSHPREQVGGIPAIHYGTHDIVVYRPHLNSCNRSHICCYTRGTFHKTERSPPNGEVASAGGTMKLYYMI